MMDPSTLTNGHLTSSPPPPTPTSTSKAPQNSTTKLTLSTSMSSTTSQTAAPRIDPAPIFETLKSLLTPAQLSLYRSTLSLYLTAHLSLAELHEKLPFLREKREILRAHNRFVSVVFANASREPPASGEVVAAWVGETGTRLRGDGERGGSGGRGDWGERRVKREVMGISARERRRLKEVGKREEDIDDVLGSMLSEYHLAKQVRPPDNPPRSAGLSKTSKPARLPPHLPRVSLTGCVSRLDRGNHNPLHAPPLLRIRRVSRLRLHPLSHAPNMLRIRYPQRLHPRNCLLHGPCVRNLRERNPHHRYNPRPFKWAEVYPN